jgi:arylsulfatase
LLGSADGPIEKTFETFDVGVDLGSVVSLDYFDRRPFRFNGKIEKVEVEFR